MDIKLLQTLIKCSDGDFVDMQKFRTFYPDTGTLRRSLKTLEALRYITVLYDDDGIDDIAINGKAREYFDR